MAKKTRRSQAKYPALRKELNTKVRRPYIEADYVNGVYNENGEQVIRPLTEEETAWLNKFYKEVIVTNFKKDGTDLYTDIEDQRQLYRENNHRNSDLYNHIQVTGRLKYLNEKKYEAYLNNIAQSVDMEEVYIAEIEGRLDDLIDDILINLKQKPK